MKTINRAAETVRKSAVVALSSAFILGSLTMPVYANTGEGTESSGTVTAGDAAGETGSSNVSSTENTAASIDTVTSAGEPDAVSSDTGNESTAASSEDAGSTSSSGDSYGNGMTDPPLSSEEAANSTGGASGSLTPSGNMTLVDDLDGGNREFLTVTTKDGNYFYLIIDKNDDGTGNVYFLNKVDEEDLLSLMDDKTASKVREDLEKQSEEQEAVEASVTSSSASTVAGGETNETAGKTDKTETAAKGQTGAEKAVICGGCAAIAGVVIAAAVRKRKKKGESRDQDDTYDDEYEEEYDFPEEEEGPGDENDEDGSEDQEEK